MHGGFGLALDLVLAGCVICGGESMALKTEDLGTFPGNRENWSVLSSISMHRIGT